MFSIKRFKTTFTKLKALKFDEISGVYTTSAEKSGPTVGITICTHGNEPAGLGMAEYLLNYLDSHQLLKGTLFIVLNNIKATNHYLTATSEELRQQSRYVDVNMNRLPVNVMLLKRDERYEVIRARELKKIWAKFDVALDIHSTTASSRPMIICRGKYSKSMQKLLHGFPMSDIITNIDQIQKGKPAFSFYGSEQKNSIAVAVEVGQHTKNVSVKRASKSVLSFLKNLGMVKGKIISKRNSPSNLYEVKHKIMFPSNSYDYTKKYKTYNSLKKGELIAKSTSGKGIYSPHSGHILFPDLRPGTKKDISEEVGFISKKVRKVYV